MDQNDKLDNMLRPRDFDIVSNKSMSVLGSQDRKSKLENCVIINYKYISGLY